MEIIDKYPDTEWAKWNWRAYRIQQYYWKGICNPNCRIGYDKINRDYDKLFTEDGRVKRIKIS